MRRYLLLAIGLAIGLIVSTFAQQEKPSLSEDRAQIVARREGTTTGSSNLSPTSLASSATRDATRAK
jgi:hypothetical protein